MPLLPSRSTLHTLWTLLLCHATTQHGPTVHGRILDKHFLQTLVCRHFMSRPTTFTQAWAGQGVACRTWVSLLPSYLFLNWFLPLWHFSMRPGCAHNLPMPSLPPATYVQRLYLKQWYERAAERHRCVPLPSLLPPASDGTTFCARIFAGAWHTHASGGV